MKTKDLIFPGTRREYAYEVFNAITEAIIQPQPVSSQAIYNTVFVDSRRVFATAENKGHLHQNGLWL